MFWRTILAPSDGSSESPALDNGGRSYFMKLIPLTHGQTALVDDADFARFGHLNWMATTANKGRTFYAARGRPRPGRGLLLLHREILGLTDPRIKGDHRNHDTLDNRRCNLRISTQAQNVAHRGILDARNTSGFRGVSWHRQRWKWRARIMVGQKDIHIGLFKTAKSAAKAYAAANLKYFGAFGGVLS